MNKKQEIRNNKLRNSGTQVLWENAYITIVKWCHPESASWQRAYPFEQGVILSAAKDPYEYEQIPPLPMYFGIVGMTLRLMTID